ncbi:MAG: OmpA family protein, partial [Pseudomonadota bacterium]
MIRHALPVLIAAIATGAQALTLAVPQGSTQTAEVTTQGATLSVPVAPLNEGFLQTEPARGTLTRRAFRVDATDLTPGQLIAPLAQQLRAAEWEVLLSCQARACGGFDFRFNLTVLPPPEMFVDLGRFEYLSARAPDGGAWVTLLASVTPQAGYVQITQVTGRGAAPGITQTATAPRPAPPNDLGRALEETGHVVLEDLQF